MIGEVRVSVRVIRSNGMNLIIVVLCLIPGVYCSARLIDADRMIEPNPRYRFLGINKPSFLVTFNDNAFVIILGIKVTSGLWYSIVKKWVLCCY